MKKILNTSLGFLVACSFFSISSQETYAKKENKHSVATMNNIKIKTETVEYKSGDTVLEGYLAYPEKLNGKAVGILVVHEWTGLGDYVKMRVEQLAKLGYVAFAPDIYGKGVRPKPPEAGKIAGIYKNDRKLMRERVNAGFNILKNNKMVDPKKLVSMGYCFGGTVSLELARSGADLAGVISFHGGLDSPTPEDGKNIKGKVLVLHGADDPYVPQKDIEAFQNEMRNNKIDWQMVLYGDAVHAFTNKNTGNNKASGAAYNKLADERSWKHMKLFLDDLFSK
ncbi:MAG: dienelactone hydrolase family protein [Candidatus Sericytochromatia bacterium]